MSRPHTKPTLTGARTKPRLIPPELPPPPPPPTPPPAQDPRWIDVGTLLAQTRAETLNKVASDPTPVTVAGANSLIPLVYGRARLGAKLTAWAVWNGNLYLRLVWCLGEIDAIEELRIGDDLTVNPNGVSGNGIVCTSYMGTQSQTADGTLVSVFNFLGQVYTDRLPGIAYSVLVIPPNVLAGFPRAVARVRGKKVRLTQNGTPTWSDNPAYALADFIESDVYGPGATADWTDVATVAADDDTMIGTPAEKKRTLNLTLDSAQECSTWINVLRDYAGCFAIPEGGVYYLPLDAATAVVATFNSANIVADSLQISKRGARDQPTVVEVTYTDTSNAIWRTNPYTEYRPGVLAGTVPRRMSRVKVPGITRYSQAVRYARTRVNDATTSDVVIRFRAFDEGIKLRAGDLIAVNHPIGFGPVTGYATGKPFRVAKCDPDEAGRWSISALEFDPGKYSNDVVPGPTLVDTTAPNPANPPALTGLVVVEEVFQVQTGYFGSRLKLTWTAAAWPFVDGYEVTVKQGTNIKEGPVVVTTGTEYVTKQLPENLVYTATVRVRSYTGQLGAAQTVSITNNGKLAKPSDVPAFSGIEVGGEVRLTWTPAIDLDLTAHEIRYSTTGGSWASAMLLDRVATPAVRYTTKAIPSGTWRFWIKGLDSVRSTAYPNGQESVNAAWCDIAVTADSNAFVAAAATFSSPTLINMSAIPGGGWATDFGQTWNSLFTAAMNTYTNPLYTYHSAGNSGLVTEIYDFGLSLTGDWSGSVPHADLSGVAVTYIELNNVGGEATKTITGATNATPIVITSTAHGYSNGDEVVIASVGGNTNANGRRLVKNKAANTYEITDLAGVNVAGNGTYSSGGTSSRWVWSQYPAASIKTAARYGRLRIMTSGTVVVSDLGALQVNVVARSESVPAGGGTLTTNASGPYIVTLAGHYNKAKTIAGALQGTTAQTWTYDSVEVSNNRGILALYGLRFDGATAYVTMGDQTTHTFGNGTTDTSFTVEAWIRPDAIGVAQVICGKSNDGVNGEWVLLIQTNGQLVFSVIDNSVPARREFWLQQSLVAGVWQHVAAVYDSGTKLADLYIDGIIAQSAIVVTGVYVAMEDTTYAFQVGRQTAGNYFAGVIDEVRLWNTKVSAANILANKDAVVSPSAANLVGYWRFDDGSGTIATDSTSNAKHGTLSGSTLPKWRPYDGFDLYAFNAAGTQVAAKWQGTFFGV